MDIVYIYKRTDDDFSIQHSLISVQKYMPWVRKIWIYGDKPESTVPFTHVDGIEPRASNFFKLIQGASEIEGLSDEFLVFADDYIVLKNVSEEEARVITYIENLDHAAAKDVERDQWQEWIMRTWADLHTKGISPVYNFETHTPVMLRKNWIKEAVREAGKGVRAQNLKGLMGLTYILNIALKKHSLEVTLCKDRAGFTHREPHAWEIAYATADKRYLFYDDESLGAYLRDFIKNMV